MTLATMHLNKTNIPDSAAFSSRQERGRGSPGEDPPRWWNKERHAARRPRLLARNKALEQVRRFFTERGFAEVETPVLQRSPGNETHLHAFATQALAVDGLAKETLYLHTSPEFACKKLLAAGEEKIFTLARTFRNREEGLLHAREFTMLEWYRVLAPLESLIEDCMLLVATLAGAIGSQELIYKNRRASAFTPPHIMTVSQAFEEFAGIDLETALDEKGQWHRENLAMQARRISVRIADDDTAGDIFSRIMVEKIEPRSGQGRLTFLTHYPLAEAALAKPCKADARFAERFELYACGVELANAFGELTDAAEQRRRFTAAMDEKQRIYDERYPLDEEFLAALGRMPPASGIALGFERLLMLLTGAPSVHDVMWAS